MPGSDDLITVGLVQGSALGVGGGCPGANGRMHGSASTELQESARIRGQISSDRCRFLQLG